MIELENGRDYFGKEFVQQFENILLNCRENSSFMFIHGTYSREDAEDICRKGLECDYPELYYTSYLTSDSDSLLYDKLKSWPHWNLKFLVMCCVPKSSGKGGTPIWKKMKNCVVLPPEFIKGYIDVNERKIVENLLYKISHDYSLLIEDTSYRPMTGEFIEISIPPEEIEMYNINQDDKSKE